MPASFQMPRGLVQTCIRKKGRAALAFGLGEEGCQNQGRVASLFASSLSSFLDGDTDWVPVIREEMLAVVLPPCSAPLPCTPPMRVSKG